MFTTRTSEEKAKKVLEGIVTSIYDMRIISSVQAEHIEFYVESKGKKTKFQVPQEEREKYEEFAKLEDFLSGVSVHIEYDSPEHYTLIITGDNFPKKRKTNNSKNKKATEKKTKPLPKEWKIKEENPNYVDEGNYKEKPPKAEETQTYKVDDNEILVGPYFKEIFQEAKTKRAIPIHIRTIDSLIGLFRMPDIKELNHSRKEYAVRIGARKIVITTYSENGKEYAHDLHIRAR